MSAQGDGIRTTFCTIDTDPGRRQLRASWVAGPYGRLEVGEYVFDVGKDWRLLEQVSLRIDQIWDLCKALLAVYEYVLSLGRESGGLAPLFKYYTFKNIAVIPACVAVAPVGGRVDYAGSIDVDWIFSPREGHIIRLTQWVDLGNGRRQTTGQIRIKMPHWNPFYIGLTKCGPLITSYVSTAIADGWVHGTSSIQN